MDSFEGTVWDAPFHIDDIIHGITITLVAIKTSETLDLANPNLELTKVPIPGYVIYNYLYSLYMRFVGLEIRITAIILSLSHWVLGPSEADSNRDKIF